MTAKNAIRRALDPGPEDVWAGGSTTARVYAGVVPSSTFAPIQPFSSTIHGSPATPGRLAEERTRARDLAWTTTAYFGEGLPFSFLHQLVTEYLTSIGAPPSVIGYTSWFHGSVALKPLWGPSVDHSGRRRALMVGLQLVIAAGMLGSAALVSGGHDGWPFAIALAVIAVLHAVHDTACDGFYIVALPKDAQARYSGTRIAAFRTAMYVGSGALVILAARTSWPLALATCGAIMGVTGAVNGALVPRVDEPQGAGEAGAVRAWLASYRSFFTQPQALLVFVFVFTYRLGDIMTFAMSPALLRDLHMDTEARGVLRSLGLTSSIVGSILAGWLLARGGLRRWLVPFTYFMAVPFYLVLAVLRPGFWSIALVVVVEQFAGALAGIALPVFLMSRVRREFSASHYALFSALVALCSTAAGGLSGHLDEAVGHEIYFALCLVASVPALALSHVVARTERESDAA